MPARSIEAQAVRWMAMDLPWMAIRCSRSSTDATRGQLRDRQDSRLAERPMCPPRSGLYREQSRATAAGAGARRTFTLRSLSDGLVTGSHNHAELTMCAKP